MSVWNPDLHPRNKRGEFIKALEALAPGERVELPGGTHVRRDGSRYTIKGRHDNVVASGLNKLQAAEQAFRHDAKQREVNPDAVALYAKGDAHAGTNRALWRGEKLTASQEAHASALDAAMAEHHEERVVYRGVDHYYGTTPRPELKAGDIVDQPGFVSTTRRRQTAMDFANNAGSRFRGGMLYEIKLPPGTPSLDVPNTSHSSKKGMYNNEEETLLARGGHLVVESVSPRDKNNVIKVRARWKSGPAK